MTMKTMMTATTARTRSKPASPGRTAWQGLAMLGILLLGGCMSFAPRPQPVSSAARIIDGVPARSWADNSCGAGALSEILNYFGDPITEARLSDSLVKSRNG